MSESKEPRVYASPKEVAMKIAALHGEKPDTISVEMIGTEDVENFVRDLLEAQKKAETVSLPLG